MGKRANPLPSVDELNLVFRYDDHDGELYWLKTNDVPHRVKGKRALSATSGSGYQFGSWRGQCLQRHRVIWKMMTGVDPIEIDHIDGDRANNRINNLRSVSHEENCRARGMYDTNTSGVTGVAWNSGAQKWMAFIHADGKMMNLGNYGAKEAAIAARQTAENIHGYNVRNDPHGH